jgi:hypothetical protein
LTPQLKSCWEKKLVGVQANFWVWADSSKKCWTGLMPAAINLILYHIEFSLKRVFYSIWDKIRWKYFFLAQFSKQNIHQSLMNENSKLKNYGKNVYLFNISIFTGWGELVKTFLGSSLTALVKQPHNNVGFQHMFSSW